MKKPHRLAVGGSASAKIPPEAGLIGDPSENHYNFNRLTEKESTAVKRDTASKGNPK